MRPGATMRAWLIAALATGAVLSCSGSSSAPAPSGLFRSDPADLMTGPSGPSMERLSYTFHRVSSLAELTALPACPDPAQGAEPTSTSWGLELANGRATVTEALNVGTPDACQNSGSDDVTFTGSDVILPDGSSAAYHWKRADQEFDVVIEVEVAAGDEDLLSKDATHDWLYGDWLLRDAPGNRITIEKFPMRITEEHLRQVGEVGHPGIPVPTTCHFRLEANAYQLIAGSGADPEVRYTAATITQVPDVRNDPGCAVYVAEEQALLAKGEAAVVWPVRLLANGDLQVEGTLVYARQ